ncbi:MAG: RNase adaptor protein RapZ, partial [Alphaproteobacteria bacterium]|nr:RNase adaptor protein RapZ [Alphaproteobacteria bacterium]
MGNTPTEPKPARVVIVTGMSGAGKSSALNFLEDAGFEAIDNLPVSLLGRLLWREGGGEISESVAVGLDIRTR